MKLLIYLILYQVWENDLNLYQCNTIMIKIAKHFVDVIKRWRWQAIKMKSYEVTKNVQESAGQIITG